MRKSTDTLRRQWELLKTVPAYPHWASTRNLHQRLCDEGFETGIRTVQRDLDFLSAPFPLVSETRGKTHYWQWMDGAAGLEIPAMSQSTALVFQLSNQYLKQLMPESVIGLLSPYLDRSEMALGHSKLSDWNDKIVSLEDGPTLIPPEVDEGIRKVVYKALLEGKQIEVEYTSRYSTESSSYPVNPLGIVLRGGIHYIVCTILDYTDIRQLAMHRIKAAVLLDEEAKPAEGFSLRKYIKEKSAFGYPESDKPIKLEVLFDQGAAWHLTERKLSDDQVIKKTKNGDYFLTATVADTAELRWWLLGFGDGLEVISPKSLRLEFKGLLNSMTKLYS